MVCLAFSALLCKTGRFSAVLGYTVRWSTAVLPGQSTHGTVWIVSFHVQWIHPLLRHALLQKCFGKHVFLVRSRLHSASNMTVIPLSLKTMESLHFGATALFSIRLLSLAHRSVATALMLTLSMFAKCVQKFQLLNCIPKMKRVKKSVIILLFLMWIFATSE